MHDRADEVSLRDLYLIFRRGLKAILAVTLLAGVGAFLYVSLKPTRYEASASVQVVLEQSHEALDGLGWLVPPVGMDSSSYRNVALSRTVLASAGQVPEGDTAQLRGVLKRLDLEDASGAQSANRLLFRHHASGATAAEATELATAWAAATVTAVNVELQEHFTGAADVIRRELESREARLEELRQRWLSFTERDESAELTSAISARVDIIKSGLTTVVSLERRLASTEAQLAALKVALSQHTAEPGVETAASLEAQLRAARASGAMSPETADLIERALSLAPDSARLGGDLVGTALSTQIDTLSGEVAGLNAEITFLQEAMDNSGSALSELRGSLAELTAEGDALKREMTLAQDTYDQVALVAPLIELQGELNSSARVTQAAVEPLAPVASRRSTITVAAALVGALLATMAVFLGAAIREPDAPGAGATAGQAFGTSGLATSAPPKQSR